jgi:hypothetical protein
VSLNAIGGAGFVLPHNWHDIDRRWRCTTGSRMLIDAAGEKATVVFRVPRTGTIDRIGFRTEDVTTAQTIRGGLETVDAATGYATGTQYGGSAVATQASPAATTFYELTLATAATATAGDIIAAVFQFDSTAGNLGIAAVNTLAGIAPVFPYCATYTSATWAKWSVHPLLSVRYSDGTYSSIGTVPIGTYSDHAVSSSTTPDEIGNYFVCPAPMRVSGFLSNFQLTDCDLDLVLYEGSTARLTLSLDKDRAKSSAATGWHFTPTTYDLRPGVGYRYVVKPTTTTACTVQSVPVSTAAMQDMLPGGAGHYRTERTDAGSWTDTTTSRMLNLALLVSHIDTGRRRGLRRAA